MSTPHRTLALIALLLPLVSGCGPEDAYPFPEVLSTEVEWSPDGSGQIAVRGTLELQYDVAGAEGEEADLRLFAVELESWGTVFEMPEGYSEPPTPTVHVVGTPTKLTVHFAGSVNTANQLCQAWVRVTTWDSYSDQIGFAHGRLSDGAINPPCGP